MPQVNINREDFIGKIRNFARNDSRKEYEKLAYGMLKLIEDIADERRTYEEIESFFNPIVLLKEYDLIEELYPKDRKIRRDCFQIYLMMISDRLHQAIEDQEFFDRFGPFREGELIILKFPEEMKKTYGNFVADTAAFGCSIIANTVGFRRLPEPCEIERLLKCSIDSAEKRELISPFRKGDLKGDEIEEEEDEDDSILIEKIRDNIMEMTLIDFVKERKTTSCFHCIERAAREGYEDAQKLFEEVRDSHRERRRFPESPQLILPTIETPDWTIWKPADVISWAEQFIKDYYHLAWLKYREFNGLALELYLDSEDQWKIDAVPYGLYVQLKSHFNRVMNLKHGYRYRPD